MKKKISNNISLLSKQLFFFCLIVAGNFIAETFSCGIQKNFSNNMYSKHVLGLMTMYFFVTILDSDSYLHPVYSLLAAIFLYLFFIIISRTSKEHTLIIIFLIFIIYLVTNIKKYNLDKEKNIENKKNKSKKYDYTIVIIALIVFIFTIYSFILYLGQKKQEYGKKFNILEFIFGHPKCKFNDLGKKKHMKNIYYINKAFK